MVVMVVVAVSKDILTTHKLIKATLSHLPSLEPLETMSEEVLPTHLPLTLGRCRGESQGGEKNNLLGCFAV